MSNRFQMIDREVIDGSIEGVHFGPEMIVIARSPKALLLWRTAYSYSINGFRHYAEPELVIIPSRQKRFAGRLPYNTNILRGGRLSYRRICTVMDTIRETFGLGALETMWIEQATKDRKTLIIEGGGPPLMPSRRQGRGAYEAWRSIPERGFYCG